MSLLSSAWSRIGGMQRRRRLRAVTRVGDEYLRTRRNDDERTIERFGPDDGTTAMELIEQLDRLGHEVQRDFAVENVVSVDGWRLSATEVRTAALVARARRH